MREKEGNLMKNFMEEESRVAMSTSTAEGNLIKDFMEDESGVGVVELILILVVLIGLVLIFKKQLTSLVNSIFDTINSKAGMVA